jgi:hypothetical protein
MSPGAPPFARPGTIEAGRQRLGMSLHQLWVGYFAVGGNAPLAQVDEWLSGASSPSPGDHDLLAQALNDEFLERGLNHPIPYSDT